MRRAAKVLRQALLWHAGYFVTYEAIEELLWGGRLDGGPLSARNIIHQYVCSLRLGGDNIEVRPGYGLKFDYVGDVADC